MSWQSGWFIAVRQHRYWCILHMADCLWGSDGYRGGRQGVLQAYGMPIHLMGIDLTLFGFSVVSDSATPRTAARQSSLSFTISQSLLKFMPIESVMLSNHLILCCPLLLLSSVFPSIRVFYNESALFQRVSSSHQVAKVLELQLQHQSFQWIFRVDFLKDWLV